MPKNDRGQSGWRTSLIFQTALGVVLNSSESSTVRQVLKSAVDVRLEMRPLFR